MRKIELHNVTNNKHILVKMPTFIKANEIFLNTSMGIKINKFVRLYVLLSLWGPQNNFMVVKLIILILEGRHILLLKNHKSYNFIAQI